ncbi:MAG: response regulator [Scytonematopsis contorta HA4267-MV1]|jgi:PAS domain S-box-containing protein|nr:response regulator [Scytonematopsis contorta HA4267-MV1]
MSNKPTKHPSSRIYGKVSLSTVLTVPFVVQIFTAVALVGYFSYIHGQKAVNDLAVQWRTEITSRIHQKLDTYLETPHQINQLNLQASKSGILNLKDFQTTGKYFWQQARAFRVGYINFGNSQGEFIGAGLEEGDTLISEKLVNTPYKLFAVDDEGNRVGIAQVKPEAKPNDAEWYTDAAKAKQPIWSAVYNWQDSPDVLAISASQAVYDKNNSLIGVLGVDLILAEINNFLSSSKISLSGQTFIIERDGMLIASSTKEKPFIINNKGKAKRIKASQLKSPLAQATANYLQQHFGDLKKIKYEQQLNFTINGENQFLQVTPWKDKRGLDWLIVVVVPESDFMAQINANTRITIFLCLSTLFVATGVGIFTARWIANPISRLSHATQDLAKKAANADFNSGRLQQDITIHQIAEIGILGSSFNQMAEQIYTAFTDLEKINNELEIRVAERTAELKKTQNELLAIFSAMTELIMVFDADGRVIKILHATSELLYKPEEEVIGKTLHEIFSSDKADSFLNNIQDSLFNKKNFNIEYSLQIKEHEVWFAGTISPIDNKTVIFVTRDISDRKKSEVALQEALLTAQSASLAKSAFLSKMSHELRTPLNVILGFTQVMIRDNYLTQEQQDNINIIHRSGNHLLQLINDVLSMSKIESGEIQINENSFSLNHFLTNIHYILQNKANSKDIKLIFKTAPDIPEYIQTDESKLRQVLINLLGNAIKFTTNGSVTLRVKMGNGELFMGNGELGIGNCSWGMGNGENRESEKLKSIFPSFPSSPSSFPSIPLSYSPLPTPHSPSIDFEIEDTGAGISSEEINSLFTAFTQTETGRKSMEGTGLGLAISQQFVQAMGGNITVTSTPNQGSIFKFAIPVKLVDKIDENSKNFQKIIGLEPNQSKCRILIVEDVVENRLLLQKILEPIGFEVKTATNGLEGINQWKNWQPHLICMDMLMPVMDGYEATKHIKARNKNTIIIALTANAFDEQRQSILAAGCDDFICKPFQEEVLLKMIANHLGILYTYQNKQIAIVPRPSQLSIQSARLTQENLSIMPLQWLQELEHATSALDDILVMHLIKQIPANETELINSLLGLIENFRLDIVLKVTKEVLDINYN